MTCRVKTQSSVGAKFEVRCPTGSWKCRSGAQKRWGGVKVGGESDQRVGEAVGENDMVPGGKQSKKVFQDRDENFGRGPHLKSDKGKLGSESLKENMEKECHEGQKRRLPGVLWSNWN